MIYRVPREQWFVAPRYQGVILQRAVAYWGTCLLLITLVMLGWRVATGPEQSVGEHFQQVSHELAPICIATLLVLPMVIVDMVFLSNRFFGPLNRLRASMYRLSLGDRIMPTHFRSGDLWHEFAADFNAVVARVELLEQRLSRYEAPEEPASTASRAAST